MKREQKYKLKPINISRMNERERIKIVENGNTSNIDVIIY